MKVKQIWAALLATLAMVTLWFSCLAGMDLIHYFSLYRRVLPTDTKWMIEKAGQGRYHLGVQYHFSVKGKPIRGYAAFRTYQNPWIAEKEKADQTKHPLTIWYSPKDPKISTPFRQFPTKSIIYALILWSLFFYFIWFNLHIQKLRKKPCRL